MGKISSWTPGHLSLMPNGKDQLKEHLKALLLKWPWAEMGDSD